jgi:hypothetical protein
VNGGAEQSRAINASETYTFESIVAGVLEVGGVHVVDFCHVFLPLFELFLVG